MIFYHGTTKHSAQDICKTGFAPKRGGKVWFARHKKVAMDRAYHKARKRNIRPVVLTCEIDVEAMRQRYGASRVHYRGGILTIAAPVPSAVLRNPPSDTSSLERAGGSVLAKQHKYGIPTATPESVAAWMNQALGRTGHNGVGRQHPGIRRLVDWMKRRTASNTGSNQISLRKFIEKSRQWLPEFYRDADLDPGISRLLYEDPGT